MFLDNLMFAWKDFLIIFLENSLNSIRTHKSLSQPSEITFAAHLPQDAVDGNKTDIFTSSAKLPIEVLPLPMFHYLLFREKSVIWSRFLNDLPLKAPEYRATRSLPHLSEKSAKWDTSSLSWKERKLKFAKRAEVEYNFYNKSVTGIEEPFDPLYPYNVEALLVDSTSIEEATNAYKNFSRRLLDKISSFSKATSKNKRKTVKIRRFTSDVVIVFLYFIVFLVLCRMSIFVFLVALNTKL